MRHEEPNSASAKDQAEGSRDTVNSARTGSDEGVKEFRDDPERDGKNDSGPEPDVHNREIPPQQ